MINTTWSRNVTKFISLRLLNFIHARDLFKGLSWVPAPSHPMAPDGHADVVVGDRLAATLNVFALEASA